MKIFCATQMPIGFLISPSLLQYWIWVELISPCEDDLCRSQSSQVRRRTYSASTSAAFFEYNCIPQDSGPFGGICTPTPRDIEDGICYELSWYIPHHQYTTFGLIPPRVNPWYPVFDRMDLFADRTSCTKWFPNQFRILLSGFAYTLIEAIRRLALEKTELASATCGSIRLKLLKIGAVVLKNTRRIRLLLSSSYPYQKLFHKVVHRLNCSWVQDMKIDASVCIVG